MPVECAFGRLKGRFRILKTVMGEKSLSQTTNIIMSCFVLHNISMYLWDQLDDDNSRRFDERRYATRTT
jgi:hypothetical protein